MPILVESSLHASLKKWYSNPGDLTEHPVDGYIIDIVRGNQLIEIQTGNFSKVKPKLLDLLSTHKVHLVHPIPYQKWIVKYKNIGKQAFSRRKSPKEGKFDHLFNELIFLPDLLGNRNFTLEVLLTCEEEIRLNDGKGSWRRQGWSIVDRKLLDIKGSFFIESEHMLAEQYQGDLDGQFTAKDLALRRNISINLARKSIYCLVKLKKIKPIGKKGRAFVYSSY